jgi:hypothetical protein
MKDSLETLLILCEFINNNPMKDTSYTSKNDNIGKSKIIVLTNGWVLTGKIVDENKKEWQLDDCSVIERWGTNEGIGELVNGPLSESRFRKIPTIVTINRYHQVLFSFPLNK